VSNYFNGSHQVRASHNALNETNYYVYNDTSHVLTNVVLSTGLTTTNFYVLSGAEKNRLEMSVDPEIGRTNSYAYQDGLVRTHTDPRGLSITNTL
jgi:hypothetical protein